MKKLCLVAAMMFLIGGTALAGEKGKSKKPGAAASGPPKPMMSAEGKKYLEGMIGRWKGSNIKMKMGDQENSGSLTMFCSKATVGWAVTCKGQMRMKKMPVQEMALLLGYDNANKTAHMFEVTNFGEVHDHAGSWDEDGSITLTHTGKNAEGKEESDAMTFKWTNKKMITFTGKGESEGAQIWSMEGSIKK